MVGQSLCLIFSNTLNFGNAVKLGYVKLLLRERVCFPTPHFFRDRVNFKLRKKEETCGRLFVFFQGHNAICSPLPDICTSGEIIADRACLPLERNPKAFDKVFIYKSFSSVHISKTELSCFVSLLFHIATLATQFGR